MLDVITAADARRWALLTRAALAARRAEIDALNVFPVPDGDTGTNLYLTVDQAIDDVVAAHDAAGIRGDATLVQECTAFRRAILLSARGNSGVIVSQVMGGWCDVVVERAAEVVDSLMLARCLERGAAGARAAVAHPHEGTILTVADAGAQAARLAADAGGSLLEVCEAAVRAASDTLARTPDQLPALARAGVVDAGGAGCVLLLESIRQVVAGTWSAADEGPLPADAAVGVSAGLAQRPEWRTTPATSDDATPDDATPDDAAPGGTSLTGAHHSPGSYRGDAPADRIGSGPAYEVMYLLEDSTPAAVDHLTEVLGSFGDSLLVVGGPDLWNVHVHVDDAGAAVEAGVAAGRPRRIRITHFASQAGVPAHRQPVGVVAGAPGAGVGALLRAAGAVVVESTPGRRVSAGQLLAAVRSTRAATVVIVPGDPDTLLTADVAAQAAAGDGIDAHVVPARATVQSLAAVAVFDTDRPVHANISAMAGAASATRHGAVSVASKEALTWAGVCHPGDVLGIVDGDVAFLGADLEVAALDVVGRLLGSGGELVTLVAGADETGGWAVARRVADVFGRERVDVEVVLVDGGQPVYPLLIGVE
ncbi:MAG: DAK2 domain-containing protein [Dermatophilaceae bacterium]